MITKILQNTSQTKSDANRKGFTLIELLVVIAIIALLAAILFPVFARARENARKSACLNNMKQIGLAMAQYTQDFDEMFPYGLNSGANRRGIGWAGMLRPYTKSAQLFSCPNDRPKGTPQPGAAAMSYAFNTFVAARNLADLDYVSKRVMNAEALVGFNVVLSNDSEVGDYKSPVDFGDNLAWLDNANADQCCGTAYNGVPSGYATGKYRDGVGTNAATTNKGRHLDGANFLLVDGHVKWYNGSQVSFLAANAPNTQISYYR
jgi:prepilin-type N-terminal cleavage/methylation domain-containing protein/prepilin-type processing-associated H-X9-DG protein